MIYDQHFFSFENSIQTRHFLVSGSRWAQMFFCDMSKRKAISAVYEVLPFLDA
jgi:hypothetical protein